MAQDRRTSEVVFLRMSGYSSSGTPTVKEASMKTAHDPHFPTEDNKLQPCVLAEGLHTARLSNGLRVIIREDQRSGVAICNVWVKVGSNREPEPMRGWSHGIEHMLFKGTSERGEGDFAREVAEAGGATNAGTGYETTNYHITVPAENLPQAIDILG
ncbi:MAG: putative Zn-dependent peptidase, partial [Candidatus Krumholzibacteriia bacterium]